MRSRRESTSRDVLHGRIGLRLLRHRSPGPPPAWRVNRSLSASSLSSGRPFIGSQRKAAKPTCRLPTQLALSTQPACHTTYQQLLVSASKEASGAWGTTTKTDMPRQLGEYRRQGTSAYRSVASQQDR
ncbi:hypothetical protein K443DRAFT_676742 [Laccaria amethystina LaAM-08-1]|uniref:Uncharacterized protein n=1 Tax=Laccaria amethystina LaAM-08-1 TaxID=1095629 RepID=A0A0C9Y0A5_9AGAR|nr:hypothetical protein K443DRAFT_676742 [Laccaria amethystina LaAM-08-1]